MKKSLGNLHMNFDPYVIIYGFGSVGYLRIFSYVVNLYVKFVGNVKFTYGLESVCNYQWIFLYAISYIISVCKIRR